MTLLWIHFYLVSGHFFSWEGTPCVERDKQSQVTFINMAAWVGAGDLLRDLTGSRKFGGLSVQRVQNREESTSNFLCGDLAPQRSPDTPFLGI